MMRRVRSAFTLIFVMLWCVVVLAVWSLVQNPAGTNGGTTAVTSFTQANAATGSGNLLVLGIVWANNAVTVTDANISGDAYTQCPSALSTDATAGASDLWYRANSTSGRTVITVNFSGSTTFPAIKHYEVSGMATSSVVDVCSNFLNNTSTTTPTTAAITTGAAGEFLVAIAGSQQSISGIHAGNEFTSDDTTNLVSAHITSTSASAGSHQAQWDEAGAGNTVTSIGAFKLAGVASTGTGSKQRKLKLLEGSHP